MTQASVSGRDAVAITLKPACLASWIPIEPTPPPAGRAAPRTFSGPHGEEMFGVPDPGFTHEQLRDELYARARRNAAGAFRELDDADAEGELDLGDF